MFLNHNGILINVEDFFITADNRGFKFGDGLFETLYADRLKIELETFHFHRLRNGLNLLKLKLYKSSVELAEEIESLLKSNVHTKTSRVRITVYRKNEVKSIGNHAEYIIQSWEIPERKFNKNGLELKIYSDLKKSCDQFANIKSNNFLPYTMASIFAQEQNIDDCIILNTNDRVCETSIANIFLIKDAVISTPALSQGCISGVMRRNIMENLSNEFTVIEKEITVDELLSADEVFISNAIRGIQWVHKIDDTTFDNTLTSILYKKLFP